MAYDTLPNISPDWDLSGETEARVLEAEFGDGYSQRVADGLNTVRQSFSLTWTNLPTADKDTLMTFFSEKKGVTPFYWTPPGEADPILFTCRAWSRKAVDFGVWTVTADLKQVFDL